MQTQVELRPGMHGLKARVERIKGNPAVSMTIVAAFILVGIFVVYPLVRVVLASLESPEGFGLATYVKVFSGWYMRRAFTNTLLVGVLTSVIGVAIGFIFAYTMAKTDVPGKKIINLLAILPVVSPPFVGAVAILLLFGSNGLITTGLLGLYDFQIYGLKGLLFAQVMTFFPIAYLTLRGVLESTGSSLEDAAFDLGASRWEVFTKVTLPLAAPGIASALLVLFIESLADFGNPLVLAGSQFPTLAVQAYLQITGMYDLAGGRGAGGGASLPVAPRLCPAEVLGGQEALCHRHRQADAQQEHGGEPGDEMDALRFLRRRQRTGAALLRGDRRCGAFSRLSGRRSQLQSAQL